MNICETQEWDFRNDTGGKPYRFVRKSWPDRCIALFTFKNHDIGLPESLKREMISFI